MSEVTENAMRDFLAHIEQLAEQSGIELDDDDRIQLFEQAQTRGFTPEGTVALFEETYPADDNGRFDLDDEPGDLDWDDDDEPDEPEFDTSTEAGRSALYQHRLKPGVPETQDEYDMDNDQDRQAYMAARMGGVPSSEFVEESVLREPTGEAA